MHARGPVGQAQKEAQTEASTRMDQLRPATADDPCMLCDLSEEGARLAPVRFKAVPDAFTLVLSKDGGLCRPRRVVWRKKLHIGVQFIAPARALERPGE
jgi:hypothetical protein